MTTSISRTAPTARVTGVSWGAVLAGAVTGVGFLLAVTALWRALAVSSEVAAFAGHLDWWNAGTAVAALAIAGALAAWLAPDVRRAGGLVHGITVWGLLLAGTAVLGTRSALATSTLAVAGEGIADAPESWWPTVVAYGLGFAAAALGGMLGGPLRSPGEGRAPAGADVDLTTSQGQRVPSDESAVTGRRTVPSAG